MFEQQSEIPYQGLLRLRRPDNKRTVVQATRRIMLEREKIFGINLFESRHDGTRALFQKLLNCRCAAIWSLCDGTTLGFARLNPTYAEVFIFQQYQCNSDLSVGWHRCAKRRNPTLGHSIYLRSFDIEYASAGSFMLFNLFLFTCAQVALGRIYCTES